MWPSTLDSTNFFLLLLLSLSSSITVWSIRRPSAAPVAISARSLLTQLVVVFSYLPLFTGTAKMQAKFVSLCCILVTVSNSSPLLPLLLFSRETFVSFPWVMWTPSEMFSTAVNALHKCNHRSSERSSYLLHSLCPLSPSKLPSMGREMRESERKKESRVMRMPLLQP